MSRGKARRRNKGPAPHHAQAGAGADKERRQSPFAALRAQLSAARQQAEKEARAVAPSAPPPPPPDSADRARGATEAALFRQAVAGTKPLRAGNRVEIERPRPAPLPRRPDEEIAPPEQPRVPGDPLLEAYAGVTPLRTSNRVELPPPAVRTRLPMPQRHPEMPAAAQTWQLPASADTLDAASLFRRAVGATAPVSTRNRVELARPRPQPEPLQREQDERAALDESMSSPMTLEDRLESGGEAAFLRPGLPRRVLVDLRRGRWIVQGELDLHGLVRDEARAALAAFLHESLQQGRRCVRIIHGKGHGSPGKVSILKQLSRGWLAQRAEILAFCQASRFDGGSGALYVLLRAPDRSRTAGR